MGSATGSSEYKKLKCKKQYGTYYYSIINPSCFNDLDAPLYRLFNEDYEFVNDFPYYGDMKYFVETGIIL